jgi:hypothetical protein
VSAAALTDYAAGGLAGDARAEIAVHLARCAPCAALERAALAGLDEAARVELGLRLLETSAKASSPVLDPAARAHVVLAIPAPPPVILAAPAETAPAWADRRVLAEDPDSHLRVVYFRDGSRGLLGLFCGDPSRITDATCSLDDVACPCTAEPEGFIYDLGPSLSLPGHTLTLRFALDGTPRALSCALVEE